MILQRCFPQFSVDAASCFCLLAPQFHNKKCAFDQIKDAFIWSNAHFLLRMSFWNFSFNPLPVNHCSQSTAFGAWIEKHMEHAEKHMEHAGTGRQSLQAEQQHNVNSAGTLVLMAEKKIVGLVIAVLAGAVWMNDALRSIKELPFPASQPSMKVGGLQSLIRACGWPHDQILDQQHTWFVTCQALARLGDGANAASRMCLLHTKTLFQTFQVLYFNLLLSAHCCQ